MYFISNSARLFVPIRNAKTKYNPASGEVIDVIPPLSVQFSPAAVIPNYAKDAVSKLASFGRGTGLDEDPFSRCGHLDTDAAAAEFDWSPEDKAFIEQTLDAKQGQAWVRADAPPLASPWPKYDSITGDSDEVLKELVTTAESIGVDPRHVAQYERQNQKRQNVIEVFEVLAAELFQDEEVVSA